MSGDVYLLHISVSKKIGKEEREKERGKMKTSTERSRKVD